MTELKGRKRVQGRRDSESEWPGEGSPVGPKSILWVYSQRVR